MGTKIIETGSTAGGIAKVEYKDEAGNVLWYYDDAGNFVRNGNAKITGLAGTGSRMIVAGSNGNLSASLQVETGSWTPVVKGSDGGTAVAGTGNTGRYTKIGKMILFSANIEWTSINGTISGRRIIEGLPYTSSNTGSHGSASHAYFTGLTCSANRTLHLVVASGSYIIYIGESDLQTGGSYFNTVTIGSSGSMIGINGVYYTD